MDPKVRAKLLSYPNVTGVAFGFKVSKGQRTGTLAAIAIVSKKVDPSKLKPSQLIPKNVNGYVTDVQHLKIRALLEDPGTYRPAPPGCSCGHYRITAGTLGAVVTYLGKVGVLSNNHVLADQNEGAVGDNILQPGPYDDGKLPIARLTEFVPINFGGGGGLPSECPVGGFLAKFLNLFARAANRNTRLQAVTTPSAEDSNLVDAAFAEAVEEGILTPTILEIGNIEGPPVEPTLGLRVQKRGRTTRKTVGTITAIDAMLQVGYGDNKVAVFEDQVLIEADNNANFSAGGDSGSLILSSANNPTALLFAGGTDESGRNITVGNKITRVLEAFPGMEFL